MSSELKKQICTYDDPNIICVSETHLSHDETMDIDKYKFYGRARSGVENQGRGHGGVGILLREDIFAKYTVEVCCNDFEGILGLKLRHNTTGYESVVVCNYLPPSTSQYGRDPEAFFGRLLQLSYESSGCDNIVFCGDFNARLGNLQDTENTDVCERNTTDGVVNSHGRSLLDFLHDTDCLVLNGRFGDDNFTCRTASGASVVDYCIVPVDVLANVISFVVKPLDEVVNELSLEPLIGDASRLPDHELLQMEIKSTGLHMEDFARGLGTANTLANKRKAIPRKFKTGYMNNDRIKTALCEIIDSLLDSEKSQDLVDLRYTEFGESLAKEMEIF